MPHLPFSWIIKAVHVHKHEHLNDIYVCVNVVVLVDVDGF
jgi:hypothetical protein